MDIAYSADYQIISAQNAVKGRRYFCPVCNSTLHFYPGKTNAPHFRHSHSVPVEIRNSCELYSQNFGAASIYEDEFLARQNVRLVVGKIDDEYIFKLKFPLIKQAYLQMQMNNLYFSYQCKQIHDFNLNTVQLLPTRKMNEVVVPLLELYSIVATNENFEIRLGLKNSGHYNPFKDGPLIFKEIQGEYISIPYRKIILSGRFFVVSKRPIVSIHRDLELVNNIKVNLFYIYEFIMPTSFTDELQRWFTVNLYYSLLSATCHLDIVSPVNFKKLGTTIEIMNGKSTWQLTNIGERPFEQRLIIIDPSNHRQMLRISSEKFIHINFKEYGDYVMYLDQEMSELITIRYIQDIKYRNYSLGNLYINNENILFNYRKLGLEKVNIKSEIDLLVHSDSELFYKIDKGTLTNLHSPIRIDLPRIWSLTLKNCESIKNENIIEQVFQVYEKQYLYPKVVADFKVLNKLIKLTFESDFKYKEKLLFLIRQMGVQLPKPIVELIK
ncbi:hypothetical protein [Solibacillus isronensis]|uniref:DUF7828 domain-containing protein n=1 Tax=Solibacillus isronensis TaxID=412383 RepID=UPI0039A06F6E